MDDVAPPQDPNPTYEKDGDNGGAAPSGEAAATAPSGGGEAGMLKDSDMNEEGGAPSGGGGGGGNLYLRPVFFGNLSHSCMASDVENIFRNPAPGRGDMDGEVKMPIALDRVVSSCVCYGCAVVCLIVYFLIYFVGGAYFCIDTISL